MQEIVRAMMERSFDVELFAGTTGGRRPSSLQTFRLFELTSVERLDDAAREMALMARDSELTALLESRPAFDFVYERYSLWSRAAIDFASRASITSILEVNAPLIDEQQKHRVLVHKSEAEDIARHVFQKSSVIAAVSEEVASYVRDLSGRDRGIIVVPNGISPARFAEERSSSLNDGMTVVFLGTLKPWHGLTLLIEVFARFHALHPEARLLIIGDGPERSALEAQLAERGLCEVAELTGAVNPDEVPALLARSDVAVAPYPDDGDTYFSPLKVVEYMAAGLPVVATAVGQIERLVEHEVTGILCRANSGDFVRALERLWDDPEHRRALGKAAREKALADYTWDAALERVLRKAGLVAPGSGAASVIEASE